jgi:hypothetical protein
VAANKKQCCRPVEFYHIGLVGALTLHTGATLHILLTDIKKTARFRLFHPAYVFIEFAAKITKN